MKKNIKTYQTVGQRILKALNNVTVVDNLEFKRRLKERSDYLFRKALKETYDKDDSPAYLIELAMLHLNMDFAEFKPDRLLDKKSNILSKIGLQKPEVTQKV